MPRYYFDITDHGGHHEDDVGVDLADFEEAREQAQGLLPDIAREQLPDGELHTIVCEVRDDAGRIVYRGRITYQGEVVAA